VSRRLRPAVVLAAVLALPGISGGAGPVRPAAGWKPLDPPAVAGSLSPNLSLAGGEVTLTWLEPLVDPKGRQTHRLRVSRLSGGRWSAPATAAAGPDFFANWADFPGLIQSPDGALLVFWLARTTGGGDYDYAVHLARSTDGGRTWKPAGVLHDDGIPAEHGFVAWVPEGKSVRAFWLDGRETKSGGAMTLRTATVTDKAGASERLDARICDCCQTDAAVAADGPVVVYRDRSDDEIRDISIIRRTAAGWSRPARVHADEWKIPGCPVNGPAVAAAGRKVAVAWFTGAPPGAQVQVAFSEDGGARFGAPVRIDAGKPLGRVDVALAPDGSAVVSWLELLEGGRAAVRLRRVRNGKAGEPVEIARTGSARASGFPRLLLAGDRLHLSWVEDGDAARLHAGSLPLASIP